MKQCGKCGKVKRLQDYRKDSSRKDGVYPYCKSCCKDYEKIPDRIDASRKRARAIFYRKYGITETEYQERFEKQNGLCVICGKAQPNKRLSVDHCHETGKVRGLLCSKCNYVLGNSNDNPNILRRAI